MKEILYLYKLSNGYEVEVRTNGIQLQAFLMQSGFQVGDGGPKLLRLDESDRGGADSLVNQKIIDYKQSEGLKNDFYNWQKTPTIVEVEGPPPPEPPIVKEFKVKGRVADKETQEPIKSIKVYISSSLPDPEAEEGPNGQKPKKDFGFETFTDEKGNYTLTFEAEVKEISEDLYSVIHLKDIIFESEDNEYGTEKTKPYSRAGSGFTSLVTIKSDVGITLMKKFVPDLKKETTKLQNLSGSEIDKLKNQIPKDPFGALQKAVMKKIQDLLLKFIPLIIGMIAKFGISKLTEALKNGFSDFNKKNCPHPDELRKLIKKRNKIVKILNSIFKFVDALVKAAGIVLTLIQIFRLVKNIVVSLPIPQAVGTPPAKDFGGLIASQPMSATLKNSSNLDQFEKFIAKYEGLTIMVLAILTVLRAVLKMAIDLLNGLDGMIQTCMQDAIDSGEIQLEEINKELQEVFAEDDEEVVYDPFINGFELSVVEDTRTPVGSLKRRYAIAKNKLGIIMLKGEPSFSASDQILMDELKFYITQNDLKAN